MFEGLKKKFAALSSPSVEDQSTLDGTNSSQRSRLKDTLFADVPLDDLLERLTPEARKDQAFAIFVQAAKAKAAGDLEKAVELLKTLTDGGQEPRVELLAWNALRQYRVMPPTELAKKVLGVIVEVAMNGGEDIVAAYPDHKARYYNYSGAGVVWETEDTRLNLQIDALLKTGKTVAEAIGPWDQKRRETLGANSVRLSMLTPSGLHFGEGPMNVMSADPLSAPVIKAAFELMQALIAVDAEYKKVKQPEV